jgi:hypothetical protein
MIFFQKFFSSPTSMETLGDNLGAKGQKLGQPKYSCKSCDYVCFKKYDWNRHISTTKHIKLTQGDAFGATSGTYHHNDANLYTCEYCSKPYSSRNGLWKHKKICNDQHYEPIQNTSNNDKLIEYLMKENKEIKDLILEIVKNGTHNTTNNTTHTNSHNKAFNLQFFLNETCKNAMNITDFVESIKLQLSDFMNIGEVGFVEGISNIIVKNLNSLDETVRPIHCTDQKRETFYIKDQNIWEKEEEDKKKLHKMIKSIAFKNEKLMKNYKEKYPDYNDPESKRSDQYSKTVIEAMDSKEESREKIIRNLSKATKINGK